MASGRSKWPSWSLDSFIDRAWFEGSRRVQSSNTAQQAGRVPTTTTSAAIAKGASSNPLHPTQAGHQSCLPSDRWQAAHNDKVPAAAAAVAPDRQASQAAVPKDAPVRKPVDIWEPHLPPTPHFACRHEKKKGPSQLGQQQQQQQQQEQQGTRASQEAALPAHGPNGSPTLSHAPAGSPRGTPSPMMSPEGTEGGGRERAVEEAQRADLQHPRLYALLPGQSPRARVDEQAAAEAAAEAAAGTHSSLGLASEAQHHEEGALRPSVFSGRHSNETSDAGPGSSLSAYSACAAVEPGTSGQWLPQLCYSLSDSPQPLVMLMSGQQFLLQDDEDSRHGFAGEFSYSNAADASRGRGAGAEPQQGAGVGAGGRYGRYSLDMPRPGHPSGHYHESHGGECPRGNSGPQESGTTSSAAARAATAGFGNSGDWGQQAQQQACGVAQQQGRRSSWVGHGSSSSNASGPIQAAALAAMASHGPHSEELAHGTGWL